MEGHLMMIGARVATFRLVLVLCLVLLGPCHVLAMAQQPIQTEQAESRQTAEDPEGRLTRATRGFDRYDLGAAAANVLWVPFKVRTCGISAGVGALAFILTLGFARNWTESAFDEGCVRNWLLTGDDFRPMLPPGASERQ
jgi:hypothetical protein